MLQGWDTKHQIINNRRLTFSGTGLGFLGEYIIIVLLSLITCGIYMPWGIVRQNKYILTADKICREYRANRSRKAAYFLMRLCASYYTERSVFSTASILSDIPISVKAHLKTAHVSCMYCISMQNMMRRQNYY